MPSEAIHTGIVAHRDALLRFIRSRGVSEADAEDILQESLLRAFQNAPDLRDEEKLTAWLFQIVRNAVADHFRRRDDVPFDDGVPAERPPTETDLLMLCTCFEPLLDTLTGNYGEIIRVVDLEGEPHASAAARLGISRTNLKVRLHRARRQLRDRLEETCRTCAEHGCLDCACR